MNTQSETPVGSVGIPIYSNNYYPEIRSTWVYRHPNHDTLRGIVVAADHETIAIKHDGSNGHCLYTTSEWNSFPKTRFYTKKDPGTFVFGSDPKKTDDGPPKNFFTSRTDAEAFLSAAGFSNKDTAYLLDGITSYEVIKPPHQFK